MRSIVFKICAADAWRAAQRDGGYKGSAVDLEDGYIHLSSAAQVEETARKHFSGQTDLVVVAFDSEALGGKLAWEPSRGGALFPHYYGILDPELALWSEPMPLDGAGIPMVPERVTSC